MIPILRRIRHSASTTARKFGPFASVATPNGLSVPSHDFILPSPEPLTPHLLALGVDESSATRISSALQRVSLLLKRDFESGIQRLHQTQDHSSAASTFITIYKRTIQQWTSYLLHDVTPRVLRAQVLRLSSSEASTTDFVGRKRPFNVSAVPILEHFFEQNAFPSRLEKIELASKCHMDFKQINIWFQNRRTRLRKEGKEPKRSERNDTFLQELEKTVVDVLLPAGPEEHDDSDESAATQITLLAPGFELAAPVHAFPSPYPPICSYDPFPEQARRSFKLPWVRSVQPGHLLPTPVIDMDDLTVAFAKLTITAGEPEKGALDAASPSSCTTYLTPCPTAPLPALILSIRNVPSTTPGELPVLSPQARPRFGRTSQVAGCQPLHCSGRKARQPVHSSRRCLSSSPDVVPSPRYKRSLPRRVPRNLPSWSPYSLRQAVRPTPSRQSSTVSTSSDCTTSGSDADSPLLTPPSLPISLPLVHDSFVLDPFLSFSDTSLAWESGLQRDFASSSTSKDLQQLSLAVSP